MILPLSPQALDLGLLISLAIAITLLVQSFFIQSSLKLISFPSLILITTIFRLGLNIASTRLILTEAQAGSIISTLGELVTQGSYVVGLITFIILTIIQFIIITKGAERVAEVAARFTLDALPGKQMSIDADLRSGMISQIEAKKQREDLHREAKFYGSMDGAMKFIKGDAIACLIILAINLVGGILTGVFSKNLGVLDSIKIFSLLSIGDGLISQLTAILVALTAAFLITRVNDDRLQTSLGSDLAHQLFTEANTYFIVSLIIFVLGCLPSLPGILFFIISAVFFVIGITIYTKKKTLKANSTGIHNLFIQNEGLNGNLSHVAPLHIEISSGLANHMSQSQEWHHCFFDLYPKMRSYYTRRFGIEFPQLKISINPLIKDEFKYAVHIFDNAIDTGIIHAAHHSIVNPNLQSQYIKHCEKLTSTTHGTPIALIKSQDKQELSDDIANMYSPQELFIRHIAKILKKHAADFIDIQQTRHILNSTEADYPELVREVVPRMISLQKLTEILARLVEEGIPIKDMRLILQTLAHNYPDNKDTVYLTEQVRIGLKKTLSSLYVVNNRLKTFQLAPELEDEIRSSIQKNGSECYIALDPSRADYLVTKINENITKAKAHGATIITQIDIRRYVKKLIEHVIPETAVISFQELEAGILIDSLGIIN